MAHVNGGNELAKYLVQKSGPLLGEVIISGAKNAVLPLMTAGLLVEDACTIEDVPALRDVKILKEVLSNLGSKVSEIEEGTIRIETKNIVSTETDYDLFKKMRASFLVMGPLLARKGHAKMPLPGGCAIGARPIDLHLKGFEQLGAKIEKKETYIEATAPEGGLVGADIYLDFPSVGATENIIMAAVLAKGTTYIENAAKEPEIIDLSNFLNKMGARIKGAGTDAIKIIGVSKLKGTHHRVIPDRIELGTFMLAAAITRGKLLIKNIVSDHVKPIIAKLRECGVIIDLTDEGMIVDASKTKLVSTDIKTLPYPGFPTDIQSPFMAFLTSVEGASVVQETVFENRFMHVAELNRMGANIKVRDRVAEIQGNTKLQGAQVIATDLRAGAAMVIAGLVADGTTEISEIYHIDRGYENFSNKFKKIGATIIRIDD